ncbi:predicted protein [Aspergillus nidulans FGSC A4]|uniref:Uncharacterized protein n=1 Tax=Emericella nidulans (strain FGSC A4 / ATCC 38163 / CBS 112.46 / NRRL 194 / M139) TaxID=227321 RepID=Q5B2A8_EMENI|nr:hypothetical protein [Aspergillus nidulans FGSC A4]EAA62482.1 predicted protein [Aspergillus nidulans FGSC A4]CBF82102.1 TPA: conserved hypothetical protein [Aspergillus nidulans FGSC A4]|eukprot:XP_662926.1 predicted protein [Aspergillus nidulans FGSC A4]
MSFPVLCINPFQGYFPQEPESYGNELGELPPPVLIWGNLRLECGEPCLPLQISSLGSAFGMDSRAEVGETLVPSWGFRLNDIGMPISRRDVDIGVDTESSTPG